LSRSYAALTRGPKSLKPCTVCLVPREDLIILTNKYELRTAEKSHQSVLSYRAMKPLPGRSKAAEDMLKQVSLRPLDVRLPLSECMLTHSRCYYFLVSFLGLQEL
jgi:hypothetical protein